MSDQLPGVERKTVLALASKFAVACIITLSIYFGLLCYNLAMVAERDGRVFNFNRVLVEFTLSVLIAFSSQLFLLMMLTYVIFVLLRYNNEALDRRSEDLRRFGYRRMHEEEILEHATADEPRTTRGSQQEPELPASRS